MKDDKNQHQCGAAALADQEWLSPEEAATLLRVGRNTLYEAIKQNKLPGVLRVGRRITIHRQALVDACTQSLEPEEKEC